MNINAYLIAEHQYEAEVKCEYLSDMGQVDFGAESAPDSYARATDFEVSVKVWGKMLCKLGGEENNGTLGLSKWSMVPKNRRRICNVKVEGR